eukprot:SAG22_NODE_2795_length_2207_cov_1.948292_2_plen_426_part_01
MADAAAGDAQKADAKALKLTGLAAKSTDAALPPPGPPASASPHSVNAGRAEMLKAGAPEPATAATATASAGGDGAAAAASATGARMVPLSVSTPAPLPLSRTSPSSRTPRARVAWKRAKAGTFKGGGPMTQQQMRMNDQWMSIVKESGVMSGSLSLRAQRIRAREAGLDRVGHGFVGWQMPLALLFLLISCTWNMGALLDAFTGQVHCTGVGRTTTCTKIDFATLVANNKTSFHPERSFFAGNPGSRGVVAGGSGAGRSNGSGLIVVGGGGGGLGNGSGQPAPGLGGGGGGGSGRRQLSVRDNAGCAALVSRMGCAFDLAGLFPELAAPRGPAAGPLLVSSRCPDHCRPHVFSKKAAAAALQRRGLAESSSSATTMDVSSPMPDRIKMQFQTMLALELVGWLMMAHGIFHRPELERGGGFRDRNPV